jgi:thioredoxin-like negative regulator of GroEL
MPRENHPAYEKEGPKMATATTRRVSKRRMEAALSTLADLTTEDHDELDGAARDEIAHVIDVLDRLVEQRS